ASDELRAQGLALQELLHDVGRAVARVRSDVVDDGDVGVIQDARGPSLLLEALEAIRVAREGGREYLDGDVAAQARIFRPVHLAHSPRADPRDDLVGCAVGWVAEEFGRGLQPVLELGVPRQVELALDERAVQNAAALLAWRKGHPLGLALVAELLREELEKWVGRGSAARSQVPRSAAALLDGAGRRVDQVRDVNVVAGLLAVAADLRRLAVGDGRSEGPPPA